MSGPRPRLKHRPGSTSPDPSTPPQRPPRKGAGGRPSFKPTAKQRADVLLCTGLGMAQHAMCELIGVSILTLRKHFERELRQGAAKLEHRNGRTIVELLQDKNPFVRLQTATLLAKSRFGWMSERVETRNLNLNASVEVNEANDASMLDAMARAFDNLPPQPPPRPVAWLPAPAPVVPIREVHKTAPTGSPDSGAVIEGEARQVPDSDTPPRGKLPRQRSSLDVVADVSAEEARIDAGIPTATRGGRFSGDL